MGIDFSVELGLLLIDIPVYSPFIVQALQVWLVMLLINFVLGVLKRLPIL